ncbi:CRTAC1 family protein [Hwangdonia sp.]|uniref:CRTAC1 family protein n=1 Tax=Hwangdonia sp. TaxID=1883432 RepID=UPI003AB1606D
MKWNKILIVLLFLSACKSDNKPADNPKPTNVDAETALMANMLKELYDTGDPNVNYHWNKKLAYLYKDKMANGPQNKKSTNWFRYCTELLRAGENERCIEEIESFIKERNSTVEQLINRRTLPIVELLALAYLRSGEVENCNKYHNAYSCILPLKDEAFHRNKNGSQKAIEIYAMMYEKFPKDMYKWLLNLAHMTLGEYPDKTPKDYFITYPNWQKEKKDFPAFKEVAMGLGIAQNGLSGGVCLDDFNNDGLIDIFATSYGMTDQCKLFINSGKGFDDATDKAGLTGIVSGLNSIQADYDNDGNVDILILRGGWLGAGGNHPNSLLKNNGDGTFTDVTKSAGLLSLHPTQTASWADVNNDGYLDLFIGNESKPNQSHPCELYINQKNGTFLEQASKHNLGDIKGFVKGVSFGDINNDQWPDLYVSIMGGRNLLFRNDSGIFKDITNTAGVKDPIFSFPCWIWDVNNDGFNDIFVNSYDARNLHQLSDDFSKEIQGKQVTSEKSRLFINNGDETFTEMSKAYHVNISMYTMGSNFGDLDNDGWLDFYIGTGAPNFNSVIPNRMFRNVNGTHFEEVTSAGRFGHIQKGHGVGFADFDNDGDQDVYAVLGGAYEGDTYPNVCFENPISINNWIVLDLEGVKSNRSAIGTKLKLELENDRTVFHSVNTGGSFGGNTLQAEIGLGRSESIKTLTVYWSNSEAQIFENIQVNKKYKIIEGQNEIVEKTYTKLNMLFNQDGHHH